MKYETRTEEDGKVVLKLGLNHEVGFDPDVELDGICAGVEMLIEKVVGVSAFKLVQAVLEEKFGKGNEAEIDNQPVS